MTVSRQILIFIDRNLRLKVTLGIVIPLIGILGAFTAIEYSRHQKAVLTNLSFLASRIGHVIESGLEHEMLTKNPQGLQHMLDAIGEDESIRIVYLLDTSGQVIFAPEGKSVGTRLDNNDATCQPCHRQPPAERPESIVVTLSSGDRVFRSMNPIENQAACHACHDPRQRLNGLLLTDISMAPLDESLKADLRENLLWWVVTMVVTVIIVNLALTRMVVFRLEQVASALAAFGGGKKGLRLMPKSQDEIGQLEMAFNDMGYRIQAEENQNRALSENLRHQTTQQQKLLNRLITAQEDERKRVARELHDELGQTLTALSLHSEALRVFIPGNPERALEQLSNIRELTGKITQQMYDLILALRPAVLDDMGLATAIKSLSERLLTDSGIEFELDSSRLTQRLPPSIEITLYRIFQEAISNIIRHSGADYVKITLAQHDSVFEGEIEDNGHGFNPAEISQDANIPRGLGLLGMQERMAQCGGSLEIFSKIGEGTRIKVRVSLVERDVE